MRIAIVGGGASGLIVAWLLQRRHNVEIFEKAPIPGGHVRTLGKNVRCDALQRGVIIENGVLGFHKATYPNFLKLMSALHVELIDDRPFARLYTAKSQYPVGLKTLLRNTTLTDLPRRIADASRVYGMVNAYRKYDAALDDIIAETPADAPAGVVLSSHRILRQLQKAILMLSYSTPFEDVEDLPAGLVLPYLSGLRSRGWCYVKGGVFTYMDRILSELKGQVHLNTDVRSVVRSSQGVGLHFENGEGRNFDKVVFAVPPGQILGLLNTPSGEERRAFALWRDRQFETVAHTDRGIYRGFDRVTRSPMDLFIDAGKRIMGYNTSMNRCYHLGDEYQYAFAYHLDDRIDAAHILDRQSHIVPVFHHESWKTREWIHALQGSNHCYYAGAWLGNGLHEGAVTSAVAVADMLGVHWP